MDNRTYKFVYEAKLIRMSGKSKVTLHLKLESDKENIMDAWKEFQTDIKVSFPEYEVMKQLIYPKQ